MWLARTHWKTWKAWRHRTSGSILRRHWTQRTRCWCILQVQKVQGYFILSGARIFRASKQFYIPSMKIFHFRTKIKRTVASFFRTKSIVILFSTTRFRRTIRFVPLRTQSNACDELTDSSGIGQIDMLSFNHLSYLEQQHGTAAILGFWGRKNNSFNSRAYWFYFHRKKCPVNNEKTPKTSW